MRKLNWHFICFWGAYILVIVAVVVVILTSGCTPSTLAVTGYRNRIAGKSYAADNSVGGVAVTITFDLTDKK